MQSVYEESGRNFIEMRPRVPASKHDAQRCRHSCCIGWEIEYSQENLGARFDALC